MSNDTNVTAAQQAAASNDLVLAYETLKAKQAGYDKLWRYYDGDQPVVYAASRLDKIFEGLDARFTQNWCAVVIDSTSDRIHLDGFDVTGNTEATKRLATLVADNELLIEADDVHDGALVTGESFVIAAKDGDGLPQAWFNDPKLCHAFYESENPRIMRMGAKWWTDESSGLLYLTLYYADRFEYYVSDKKAESVTSAAALRPDPAQPTAVNPYGRIPFFHFRVERRRTLSDLTNVIPLQNGVNKLLTDMMVAAEFGAFPQKWAISNVETKGKLLNAPNIIWDLPAGDGTSQPTQVGQFSPTDLDNYLKAVDKLALAIAAITRTPKHYFFGEGGDPSGEALLAMESPLVKKAQDRIDRFKPVWQRLAAFLLELSGMVVAADAITPRFADPRTVQPKTQSEIRQANTAAGWPMVSQMRDEGKPQAQIDQVLRDKADEAMAQSNSLAEALLNQQRQFDQNNQSQPVR